MAQLTCSAESARYAHRWDPPPFVDIAKGEQKADLLSTIEKVSHDAKSTERLGTLQTAAFGSVSFERQKPRQAHSARANKSARFVIFDVL